MSKIVAVVPVKKKSERLNDKNFRKFYKGKSLFDLLIDKLLLSKMIEEIYISSNNLHLEKKVKKLGCNFIYREDKYCNNVIPWSDMIYHTIDSIPVNNQTVIAWCHTTTPLFDSYDKAIKKFLKDAKKTKCDGLVVVSKFNEFIVSENKKPINYSWGPWHQYSQYLEQLYTVTGSMFVAKKNEFLKNRYVISKQPSYYEISRYESLDIDDAYDFELAKILMKNYKIKKYA